VAEVRRCSPSLPACTTVERPSPRPADVSLDDPAVVADLAHGPGPTRLIGRRFAVVTAATFAYFVALGALLPTLPRYVEDELDGGGVAVGLVVGVFAVSAAVVRPWAGRLGDVRGRRILITGGSLIVGFSVLAYALTDALAPLVALRLVSGIGEAAVFVGAATAIQDLAPEDRRGEAASYFSVALYAGIAVGPMLGEWLADEHGFHAVWYAAGGCALLAALLGLGTERHHGGPVARPERLLHPAALGPGLVLLLGLVPFVGFGAFIELYGEGIGLEDVGPVFAAYAVAVLLIRVVGARLPDRLGWRVASTIALVSVGSGALLLAAWASVAAVWLSAACFAVGMSLLFPALFSAAVAGVPEEQRSQAVGTFSLFFDLANGLGAPLLGAVVALSSYRGAFLAAAVIAACGWFAQLSLSRR
jgi:MFS family permease